MGYYMGDSAALGLSDPTVTAAGSDARFVTFKRETGREAKTLTILGPWDSDPANGIVSYLAPAIQPVLGKAPGDAAQFQDGRWLVDTIRGWREV